MSLLASPMMLVVVLLVEVLLVLLVQVVVVVKILYRPASPVCLLFADSTTTGWPQAQGHLR